MSKPVWVYVLITYLVTWSITLTSYYMYRSDHISLDELNLLFNFGALGPFAGALITSRMYYGKKGSAKLLGTFKIKTMNRASLLLCFSPILFLLPGLLLYPLFTGHRFSFAETQRQFHLSSAISYASWSLPFITHAFFEEFGWRGFLLPHLQSKHTAMKATLILTTIWACWHLPFFLWRFQFSAFIAFGFFFSIFVGSLLLTATFNFSRGSIVATILFHLCNNIASALDKEYMVAVISTGFVFLAVYVVRRYKRENLADVERVKNFYVGE